MKIKYITNVRIPTSRAQGYAIMKMCEEFINAGAELELVVPNRQNNESESDPFKYYGVKKVFNIRRIKSIDLLGPYEAFGKLFYWIDTLSFLTSLVISRVVKSKDIIYTRDFLIPFIFSKNRFIVMELHEIPSSRLLFKYSIKKPKLFFVLNQYIKQILIDMGVDGSKIFIAPSGVDLKMFENIISREEARKNLNLPQDKKIVMYTGHFYDWKGVDTLADVAKELSQYQFVFVGGVEPELTAFKNKYGSLKNILALPFQERSSMPLFNQASDVVVIPNSAHSKISSEYTSPLKLFEYMASKRPIVASSLPSLREILDESSCVFAKPDDVSSFALAINRVLGDNTLAEEISSNAFEKVKNYSWESRAKKILNTISKHL